MRAVGRSNRSPALRSSGQMLDRAAELLGRKRRACCWMSAGRMSCGAEGRPNGASAFSRPRYWANSSHCRPLDPVVPQPSGPRRPQNPTHDASCVVASTSPPTTATTESLASIARCQPAVRTSVSSGTARCSSYPKADHTAIQYLIQPVHSP